MKKSVGLLLGFAIVATPAIAQVRPENCQPVFPVMDRVAAVLPQDVVAEPASPVAAAAKRKFLGLPFLLPALAGLGGIAAIAGGGGGGNPGTISPA